VTVQAWLGHDNLNSLFACHPQPPNAAFAAARREVGQDVREGKVAFVFTSLARLARLARLASQRSALCA